MNIYDIAKKAGVSPATVSRVLNNKDNVKDSTRNKVLQVIEGAAYKPSTIARNLSFGESRNIAFLVPDIENPFFSKILHGISDCALENDYNVFMYGTDENLEREHKILNNLQKGMICGLIITPVSDIDIETLERLKNFEEDGIPVILIDRDIQGYEFDGVFSNDIQGACNAVECLIQSGHRKIAIITGPNTSKPGKDRCLGYKNALKKHNIELNDNYIVSGGFKEQLSYLAMEKLMNLTDPPTAIFSCNNMTTLGCLRYMKDHHLKLGEHLSMVCVDKIEELEYGNIYLTSVTRPVYEMGYEAMKILNYRFNNNKDPNSPNRIVHRCFVNPSLEIKGSEKNGFSPQRLC